MDLEKMDLEKSSILTAKLFQFFDSARARFRPYQRFWKPVFVSLTTQKKEISNLIFCQNKVPSFFFLRFFFNS
jgi:hypothetical protein